MAAAPTSRRKQVLATDDDNNPINCTVFYSGARMASEDSDDSFDISYRRCVQSPEQVETRLTSMKTTYRKKRRIIRRLVPAVQKPMHGTPVSRTGLTALLPSTPVKRNLMTSFGSPLEPSQSSRYSRMAQLPHSTPIAEPQPIEVLSSEPEPEEETAQNRFGSTILEARFNKFFEFHKWANLTFEKQLNILLDLAETHPDLPNSKEKAGSRLQEKTQGKMANTRGRLYRSCKSTYSQQMYEKDDDDQNPMEEDEDSASSNVDFSADSDGSWDEKAKPEDFTCEMPLVKDPACIEGEEGSDDAASIGSEDDPDGAMKHRSKRDVGQLPLLETDYYLKFSEEARNTCSKGSKRTIAAMANTRRYIVERRQLKKLLAQCNCATCGERLDLKSLTIREYSFAMRATAYCRNIVAKHKFVWASSAEVRYRNETGRCFRAHYVINTVIPAAVVLSGNNFDKMTDFAKILRLQWIGSKYHLALQRAVFIPVVRKCFETTQQEMLAKLKEEKGRVVLAGDGQFDSPGSCATLCTYTVMALGVDEEQEDGSTLLKKCGYVLNQAVIDRRHADNKSVNMERMGLHWALQPIIKAGIKVAELVTDDHIQIAGDFRKIKAASDEQAKNTATTSSSAMTAFKDSLTTALQHFHPPVDVGEELKTLLSFYGSMAHSNDIWHKAKNLLKIISTIAQTAPSKEQQCYRRYAKMLKNYLWYCAEKAEADPQKFLDLWQTVCDHLQEKHDGCESIDLHAKTKLMTPLDQTTRSFARLIVSIRRIEKAAPYLCRFRNTGILENYNCLTLKYCPKRVKFTYDVMGMRKELAALDHNHHVLRPYRIGQDGQISVATKWSKATKGYSLIFRKAAKDYVYRGHLMAAMLMYRCHLSSVCNSNVPDISAAHPTRIQKTIALVSEEKSATRAQWLAKKKAAKSRIAKVKAVKPSPRKKKRKESPVATSSSSENEPESSDSDSMSDRDPADKKTGKKRRKKITREKDREWLPDDVPRRATKKKPNVTAKGQGGGRKGRPKRKQDEGQEKGQDEGKRGEDQLIVEISSGDEDVVETGMTLERPHMAGVSAPAHISDQDVSVAQDEDVYSCSYISL